MGHLEKAETNQKDTYMQRWKKIISRSFIYSILCLINITAQAALYVTAPLQSQLLTSKALHIFMCGTGDPEPGMQGVRKPACLAVIGNGQFFLFDAGEGSIQTLAGLGLPIDKLNHVFITHWHSDHFGGLGQVANETWIRGRDKKMIVHGPKGVKSAVTGLRRAYAVDTKARVANRKGHLNKNFAFSKAKRIRASEKGVKVYQDQGVTVSAFTVDHMPVKHAVGYRIQYQGCDIVISGDTKITPSLANNAKNADVLINESISNPLYQREVEQAKKSSRAEEELAFLQGTYHYHSDSLQLAKMAEKEKVKNLFITHLIPAIGTSPEMTKAFTEGMDKYYRGPITVTNDRDEIVVTPQAKGQCKVDYRPAPQPEIKIHAIPADK